jgi:DNA-binding XRE family transcriptional regulator
MSLRVPGRTSARIQGKVTRTKKSTPRLEKDRTHFGSQVKYLRRAQDKKQKELATSAGVSSTYLSLIENGRRAPTFETAQRIANSLGAHFEAVLIPND